MSNWAEERCKTVLRSPHRVQIHTEQFVKTAVEALLQMKNKVPFSVRKPFTVITKRNQATTPKTRERNQLNVMAASSLPTGADLQAGKWWKKSLLQPLRRVLQRYNKNIGNNEEKLNSPACMHQRILTLFSSWTMRGREEKRRGGGRERGGETRT